MPNTLGSGLLPAVEESSVGLVLCRGCVGHRLKSASLHLAEELLMHGVYGLRIWCSGKSCRLSDLRWL